MSVAPVHSLLPDLPALLTRRLLPTDLLQQAARRNPRLAHLSIGPVRLCLISEPTLIREAFVGRAAHLVKGIGLQRARILLGEGLLTAEGDHWRRHRRLVQPAFHREQIHRYTTTMIDTAAAHQSQWRDGQRIDVAAQMSALTLEIAGRTLLGAELGSQAVRVRAALAEVMARSRKQVLPGARLLDRMPLPAQRRAYEAIQELDGVVYEVIRNARARSVPAPDILGMLLSVRDDDGAGLSDREIRDEVMTLMLAGHETTAMAMSWTFVLLNSSEPLRKLLHDELGTVLGGRPPTGDDLSRLAFCRAVIAESMRLFPPAWAFTRQVVKEFVLDGNTIPNKCLLIASPWSLHRDERFWPDPDAFNPQRWLTPGGAFDADAPGQPRDAYLPFGIGQRICIGESFAWTEATLLIAALSQRWHLDVDEDYRVRLDPAITLRPATAIPATIRERNA